ncbi:MAG: hypothetical protein J6X02_03580 [Bacilli bacterium]|nr:hypothetical protein [Bacilli bacterium]
MDLSKYNEHSDYGCYNILKDLLNNNDQFREIFVKGISDGTISFFSEELWNMIRQQNFIPPMNEIDDFIDFFKKGYNIGTCGWTTRQLSYSFDNISIVAGTLAKLKGTFNSEKEGGNFWLEDDKQIIDTSLMLIIDKSLKDTIGYSEEKRLEPYELARNQRYQERKYFTLDKSIKKSTK